MASLTYLSRRGSTFYFRVRVPIDLQSHVRRGELWRSLRTSSPDIARSRAAFLLSLTLQLWKDLASAMDPVEAKALVEAWLKAELDRDADIRRTADMDEINAHEAVLLQRGRRFGPPIYDPSAVGGIVSGLIDTHRLQLTDPELELLSRIVRQGHTELFRAVSDRSRQPWFPWENDDPAASLVERLRVTETGGHPRIGNDPAQPLSDRLPLDQATINAVQVPSIAGGGLLFSEAVSTAIVAISAKQAFPPKRIDDYENAAKVFLDFLNDDPPFDTISRQQAGLFMRSLERYPSNASKRPQYRDLKLFSERLAKAKGDGDEALLSPTTINTKYVTPLRAIYDWHIEGGFSLANPFATVRSKPAEGRGQKEKRRSISDTEVLRLLSLPLFTGAAGLKYKSLYRAGSLRVSDWRYWVPLICLFTGMRLNEACGLGVSDVRESPDGVLYFHVRDEIEGQRLKSIAARRRVPIHSALLDAGIMRTVDDLRNAGRTRLFNDLKEDKSGYFSARPSKFFADLRKWYADEKPEEPGDLVFHSKRHAVTSKLRAANVRLDVSKAVVGHEQGEVHGNYGGFDIPVLKEAIEKIMYPGLDVRSFRLL